MRTNSVITGLALALTLGAAGVASAQGTGQSDSPRRSEQEGAGRRGGPETMLLRGITLSADQQTRLRELADQRRQAQGERPQGGWGANGQGQPQRERGDTTGMGARRAQMQQRREQHIAAIRSILTPDQQAQFDRNVADMKAHQGERGGRERPNQR